MTWRRGPSAETAASVHGEYVETLSPIYTPHQTHSRLFKRFPDERSIHNGVRTIIKTAYGMNGTEGKDKIKDFRHQAFVGVNFVIMPDVGYFALIFGSLLLAITLGT